jgi:hypothetical protein
MLLSHISNRLYRMLKSFVLHLRESCPGDVHCLLDDGPCLKISPEILRLGAGNACSVLSAGQSPSEVTISLICAIRVFKRSLGVYTSFFADSLC